MSQLSKVVTVFTCVRNTSRSIHNASVLSFQRTHGIEVTSFAALGFLLIHTMTGCWTRRERERERERESKRKRRSRYSHTSLSAQAVVGIELQMQTVEQRITSVHNYLFNTNTQPFIKRFNTASAFLMFSLVPVTQGSLTLFEGLHQTSFYKKSS